MWSRTRDIRRRSPYPAGRFHDRESCWISCSQQRLVGCQIKTLLGGGKRVGDACIVQMQLRLQGGAMVRPDQLADGRFGHAGLDALGDTSMPQQAGMEGVPVSALGVIDQQLLETVDREWLAASAPF
jgi:hypothetical protein